MEDTTSRPHHAEATRMPSAGRSQSTNLHERRKRIQNRGQHHQADEDYSGLVDDSDQLKTKPESRHPQTFPANVMASRVSSLVLSWRRFLSSSNRLEIALQWIRTHRRLCLAVVFSIPFILRPSRLWRWRYQYFGKHNIHGGPVGQRIEIWSYKRMYRDTMSRQEQRLKELGVVLPPVQEEGRFRMLEIETQAALRELLIRREKRGRTLGSLEKSAERGTCSRQGDLLCTIPSVIFVPDAVSWNPPRPGKASAFQLLFFDEREMRELVADTMPSLLPGFDSLSSLTDRIHLWSLCAVYYFGGAFVGDLLQVPQAHAETFLYSSNGLLNQTAAHGPLALALLDTDADVTGVSLLVSTPRHPQLLCVLRGLERVPLPGRKAILTSFSASADSTGWQKISNDCGSRPSDECCRSAKAVPIATDQTPKGLVEGSSDSTFYVYKPKVAVAHTQSEDPVTVSIRLDPGTAIQTKTKKNPFEPRLRDRGLEPGWFCMRCIKMPMYGTIERCARFCPEGYTDMICRSPDLPEKVEVPVEVTVRGPPADSKGKSIPKIIHQTWFEDVSIDRYPQLARLQNSWKNTGWEYRLYTDETARQYIVDHFPARFADAFDAFIPGAYKADLFRYLVLMKEGGVYADVDILLETTLDNFITPSMSFFAPRDVVGEYAGEPFCLWNGLIGAAPGHPFMIQTVERLVGLILDRADVYDMERDICRKMDEPAELWKIRSQTILLESGPCGLGVAVNDALGRPSMQTIDVGWMGLDKLDYGGREDHGDALIMVVDKKDLGSFRISDPERNSIVASTNLEDVEKDPRELSNPTMAEKARQNLRKRAKHDLYHYSDTQRAIWVWGSTGVYKDLLVSNERIKFEVRYETN